MKSLQNIKRPIHYLVFFHLKYKENKNEYKFAVNFAQINTCIKKKYFIQQIIQHCHIKKNEYKMLTTMLR
jgi:hypothetical protein